MHRPEPGEYGAFYEGYINLTRGADVLQNLQDSSDSFINTLHQMLPAKGDYAYAPGKWTVKEVIRHLIDTDVVFLYRALHIARGGKDDLPGFDENDWARRTPLNDQKAEDLLEDFRLLRNFTINTFHSFSTDMLNAKGTANQLPLTTLAQGFIMAGHTFHHTTILKERYL